MNIPTPDDIKKKRRELNLTQADLAKLAGVSQPLIARIEAGGVDPRLSTLGKIIRALNEIEGKKAMVSDIMHTPVVSVSRTDSVAKAMELMEKYGFSQLPVLEDGRPVGSVSVDAISRCIIGHESEDIKNKKVEELMEEVFPSIPPTMEAEFASHLLEARGAVLVYDEGKVVGILTKHDLMKLASERWAENEEE
ncbi:MAG TPA: CBS domain-containing protein [Methermicoccus shengliensis]|uniref:CBS domain-containing protein n=1 Tax=Methermicoccus shengliensis TaxID=660064 RepID=A0A832VZ82_9EURY|nr:CBS domain-containing protein [Methermicoccus shengliensis]HIH69065.1 CBS domain-containing protein [Methermicoccus shengliensis]